MFCTARLLLPQLHEANHQYQGKIQELEHRLNTLERENSQHEEVLNATRLKSKTQVDKLQEEKAMLEVGGGVGSWVGE